MSKKGVLSEEVRDEVVMRLAMFDTVKDVHADLVERGYEISQQAISKYNPYNAGSPRAPKRKELFDKTRESFLNETAQIPIASRTYRLRKLNSILDAAMKRGAYAIAQNALEQAAKEVGDVYSKPNAAAAISLVPIGDVDLGEFSPEEKRNMLADRLAQVFGAQGGSRTVQ